MQFGARIEVQNQRARLFGLVEGNSRDDDDEAEQVGLWVSSLELVFANPEESTKAKSFATMRFEFLSSFTCDVIDGNEALFSIQL